MTASNIADSREPMNETVRLLTETLAQSERRTASLERIVRWVVLGIVAGAVLVGAVAFNFIQRAQAQVAPGGQQSVAAALDRIGDNLQMFGMLQQVMGVMTESEDVQYAIIRDVLVDPERVDELVKTGSLDRDGAIQRALTELLDQQDAASPRKAREKAVDKAVEVAVTQLQLMDQPGMTMPKAREMAQQMLFMRAAAQVIVDASVVMKRVRADSDALHSKFHEAGGPTLALNHVLAGIQEELQRLNVALAAVPVMAGEMNVMNRQIGVMAHGVGSTMGRMGNIMPW
jgi:hypothetical protein